MSERTLTQSRKAARDLIPSGLGGSASLRENQERTLVDELLAEQQSLTAVERFSRWHDREHSTDRYSHLMPATAPGPGEQYRFEVNLDACTGCKACVSACHALNGLDDDEAWRDVGVLFGGRRGQGYLQTVTSACHHCADPGCANGCPVAAYEKEEDTGVVRHLDDQCIGCQYCVLKCPYDVPKYNAKLGIVRKCDMCVGRLREGEAPACVQACPTSAIRIRLVKKDELTFTTGTRMLPGAFESSYTRPSTQYLTSKEIPLNTQPADAKALRLEHAHWPLVWMLVLTQMSVGMFVMLAAFLCLGINSSAHLPLVLGATALLKVGLGVSVLHLGRPLGAWRFFLGLRTSWMSREILAFSLLAGAAVASCAAVRFDFHAPWVVSATALLGLTAVFTSAMIYIDTHRPFWNWRFTSGKFLSSVLVLGSGAAALLTHDKSVGLAALFFRVFFYAWSQTQVRRALVAEDCAWQLSARVIQEKLRPLGEVQDFLLMLSLVFSLPALTISTSVIWPILVLAVSLTAQIIDRYIFFTAAMGPRMTGGYQPS